MMAAVAGQARGFSIQALREVLQAPEPASAGTHRARLMIAMAEAVAEKGYGATTIADVVRHARVSRRTFYEHFEDKEACFLAAYEGAAALILETVRRAATAPDVAAQDCITAALDAYLDAMTQEPALTRVFLIEILGAGPRALARRRAVHERFADEQRALIEDLRRERPQLAALSPAMSMALVAAVNELVLLSVDDDSHVEVEDLRTAALELLRAAIERPVPS